MDDDTLVLSLKGGELYVLMLLADSMRYVRNFHFEKAAASVLTTCVSMVHYFTKNYFNSMYFFRYVFAKTTSCS